MTASERPACLVPLDGSPEAERAAPYVQAPAASDGELALPRVVRGPEEIEDWWVILTADEQALASAEEAARHYLASIGSWLRARMLDRDIKRVPVVRHGTPVGAVTRNDLLKLLIPPRQDTRIESLTNAEEG
jgi:hypothetical protein